VHTVVVDWGDESGDEYVLDVGDRSYTGSHTYAAGGIYEVKVQVVDDDTGASEQRSMTVLVTGAGIHNGVLQIIGTRQDDHVTVNQTGNGVIKVHAAFLPTADDLKSFPAAQVDRIWIILCYGNDQATISSGVKKTAIIDGGPGDDKLNGGGGSNILLGGSGNDMLIGGSARDILIGGDGEDRLVGNPGEDILIGGGTTYDSGPGRGPLANDVALLQLLSDWNKGDPFATRKLAMQSHMNLIVEDDGDKDVLTGASGEDWFVTGVGDVVTDVAGGKKK
jgi:Ca2+-binding RTX toxin-like protein